jgi:hypothetical protein
VLVGAIAFPGDYDFPSGLFLKDTSHCHLQTYVFKGQNCLVELGGNAGYGRWR